MKVGQLEEILRKYSKDTEIRVSCGSCHRGSGGDNLIELYDSTSQTYGDIELKINNNYTPDIELSKDKEEFYKKEIERLENKIKEDSKDLNMYKRTVDDIEKVIISKEFYRF